jgi:hypothetical protein
LQLFDDVIFAFFTLEMMIKMIAMGGCGRGTYLADSWNRLDFFIVMSGALEYVLQIENLNLTAIRTIRVLRPLRAINRIPSKPFFLLSPLEISYQRQAYYPSFPLFLLRHANPRDVIAGHIAYARKRSSLVFLCLFHFRHYWRAVVGGYFAAALRLATARLCPKARVSTRNLHLTVIYVFLYLF